MKKLWHELSEIPEYPEGAGAVRIICLSYLDGLSYDIQFKFLKSIFIYRKQSKEDWIYLAEVNQIDKWCYWDELISDNVFFRYDSVEEE